MGEVGLSTSPHPEVQETWQEESWEECKSWRSYVKLCLHLSCIHELRRVVGTTSTRLAQVQSSQKFQHEQGRGYYPPLAKELLVADSYWGKESHFSLRFDHW